MLFFQSSTQASFRFSSVFAFAVPTWNFIDDASTFVAGTVSFPEDRTVLSLIIGLKMVRIRCFSRIRFKVSPKSTVQGKLTLDLNSGDLLFFFLFFIIHFG